MNKEETKKNLDEFLRQLMVDSDISSIEFLIICDAAIADLKYFAKYKLSANPPHSIKTAHRGSLIEYAKNL